MDQRGGPAAGRGAAAACVGPDPEARADVRRELGGALSGPPPASRRKQTALSVRGGEEGGGGEEGWVVACQQRACVALGPTSGPWSRMWTGNGLSAAEGLRVRGDMDHGVSGETREG